MRIIWAQCTVRYSGRGDTRLDSFDRVIIIKDDGSISVHSNAGVKPLNYMGAKSAITSTINDDGLAVLHADSSKESLSITLERVYSDQEIGVSAEGEPGLVRDGTEDHLQQWLSSNLSLVIPDVSFVSREFETGSGKVDIMGHNGLSGNHTLVEVKRVAVAKDVYQVKRYLDAFPEENKHGILIALDVRPKARALAEKRGVQWIELTDDMIEKWKHDTKVNVYEESIVDNGVTQVKTPDTEENLSDTLTDPAQLDPTGTLF